MSTGIKISKSGKSVTSTNPQDYILNSKWGKIKIIKQGGGTQTVNASTTADTTIPHGAGFYPIVLLFVEQTPGAGRWYGVPFKELSGESVYISSDLGFTSSGKNVFSFRTVNTTGDTKNINYYYFVIGATGHL